jgi:NCAIR mutase (PurE)-related protein
MDESGWVLDGLLSRHGDGGAEGVPVARLDLERERRKGVPEIVLAEGKRLEHVEQIVERFVATAGRCIVSRARPAVVRRLRARFADCSLVVHEAARMVVVRAAPGAPAPTGATVAVLSAGTADVPVAEEARVVAEEMGCRVLTAYDVGVAGLHRLAAPLAEMRAAGVDAVVVAAGMDGALPSVVAGLVAVPVIGVPTSVGYGAGGRGLAALLSMLQTCVPGLVVVNVDNGVGAGATAALIANRTAAARGGASGRPANAAPAS